MFDWLKSIFGAPQPSGPPETIRLFRTTDRTLTQSGIAVAQVWVKDVQLLRTPLSS